MKLHPKQQHMVDVYGKLPETLDELAEACIAVINEIDPVIGFAWDIHYDPSVSASHNAPIGHRSTMGCSDKNIRRNFPGFYGRYWIRYAKTTKDTFGWSHNISRTLTYGGTGGGGAYNGLWTDICHAYYVADRKLKLPKKDDLFALPYDEPKCFSTDYRFFLMDHPGLDFAQEILEHEYEQDKQETWHKVKGRYYSRKKYQLTHKFEWEDPAVKAADAEYIKAVEFYDQADPAKA